MEGLGLEGGGECAEGSGCLKELTLQLRLEVEWAPVRTQRRIESSHRGKGLSAFQEPKGQGSPANQNQ